MDNSPSDHKSKKSLKVLPCPLPRQFLPHFQAPHLSLLTQLAFFLFKGCHFSLFPSSENNKIILKKARDLSQGQNLVVKTIQQPARCCSSLQPCGLTLSLQFPPAPWVHTQPAAPSSPVGSHSDCSSLQPRGRSHPGAEQLSEQQAHPALSFLSSSSQSIRFYALNNLSTLQLLLFSYSAGLHVVCVCVCCTPSAHGDQRCPFFHLLFEIGLVSDCPGTLPSRPG